MSLAAGSLNRRISIQMRDEGRDDAGQPVDQWVPLVSVWANVSGQTGMRTITGEANGIVSNLGRYSFRIRFRDGLSAGMRIVLGAQTFNVREVRNDFATRQWTDLVGELVAIDE